MILGIAVPLFLIMFALVVLATTAGFRYLEAQRKKRVAEMLKTAGGEAAAVETKVLVQAEGQAGADVADYLRQFGIARTMEQQIQQAGMNMPVATLLFLMIVFGLVGTLLALRFNPLMFPIASGLAGFLFAGSAPYFIVLRARRKRLGAFEEQFPEALDFLARAMRAGHAFSISLEMLSEESPQPLGQEFRKVFNEHNLGLPIEDALHNLADRAPLLDVKFFVSAVLLQRETGGNLAEILTKLAHVIRERFKLKGQVKALSAHGRITGTVLTLMPVVLALGLMVVAPQYLPSMAKDSDGRYMILGAILGQLLGHYSIRRIINIKV